MTPYLAVFYGAGFSLGVYMYENKFSSYSVSLFGIVLIVAMLLIGKYTALKSEEN